MYWLIQFNLELIFRIGRLFIRRDYFPIKLSRAGANFLAASIFFPRGIRFKKEMATTVPGLWIGHQSLEQENVILYLHGGGYHVCSPLTHSRLIHRMCIEANARAFAIDYRMAPEHPFPAAVDDAVIAYEWLLAQRISAKKIAIAGDSAGGGLAMATLVRLRDLKLPMPGAGVLLSPWLDIETTGITMQTHRRIDPMVPASITRQLGQSYLQGADPRHPLASPIYADLTGLPPVCLHVGAKEVLISDAERFEERASEFGLEVIVKKWPRMFHVFQAFYKVMPTGRESLRELGQFIQQKLA